jgi:hypothetical protein
MQKKIAEGGIYSLKARDQDIPETMDVDSSVKLQMIEHKVNDLAQQLNLLNP